MVSNYVNSVIWAWYVFYNMGDNKIMKKKRYIIYHASVLVTRRCGVKEIDTFSFIIQQDEFSGEIEHKMIIELNNQIELFNDFCPEDMQIIYCDETDQCSFEKVGEIWL